VKVQIDWPELMRFKGTFTEPVPKRREDGFAKAGVAAFPWSGALRRSNYSTSRGRDIGAGRFGDSRS
jgi:hypothetical protein